MPKNRQPIRRRFPDFRQQCVVTGLVVCIVILTGCPSLKKRNERTAASPFPLYRLNNDTVVLEIAVFNIEDKHQSQFESAWRHVDSQHAPFRVRKLLDDNGLQSGILGTQMPSEWEVLVEPDPIDASRLTEREKQLHERGFLQPKQKKIVHQRIQNRAGERHIVPIKDFESAISWKLKSDAGQKSGVFPKAQPFFAVTTYPNGNGTVSLVLTPEFHYGEKKNRFSALKDQLVYDHKKESFPIDDVALHATLRPGETVMVTCNSNTGDLGQSIFQYEQGARRQQRILMIRLAHSQRDDLFGEK